MFYDDEYLDACEYCKKYDNLEYFNGDDANDNFGEITIAVVDGKLSYEFRTDNFYKDGNIPINYCPMCGESVRRD